MELKLLSLILIFAFFWSIEVSATEGSHSITNTDEENDSSEFNYISLLLGFISRGLPSFNTMPLILNEQLNNLTNVSDTRSFLSHKTIRSISYLQLNPSYQNSTPDDYNLLLKELTNMFEEALPRIPLSELSPGDLSILSDMGKAAHHKSIKRFSSARRDHIISDNIESSVYRIIKIVTEYLEDACDGIIRCSRMGHIKLCLRDLKTEFRVSFYSEPNFRGLVQSYGFKRSRSEQRKCMTFDNFLNNYISSVDVGSGCVILYSGVKCTGLSLVIQRGIPFKKNLSNVRFNDVTQSFRIC